ncbi:MAG: caspase family protein, partial [Deltaproteobacteria bacterium]|nr:caspase family protein [Deltaproteobacteria bacterium]
YNPDAVAVVIGNRNYEHNDIPPVDYAHHDAEIMKQYLINTLGYKEGNILFEKDASKTKFEGLFGIPGNHKGEVYDYIKPNRSDVFVYYSGHGAPDLDNMKGYFVPTDCDPERVALNGYSLDLLYENLSKLEARKVTVVLEACFSGATNTGIYLAKSASPALINVDMRMLSVGNITVLTSSDSNQISSWYDEMNHGLFTYFFLQAIGGAADTDQNNQITFQEIHNYVADRSEGVPYWAKRLHGGRTQTPMLYSNRSDDVFVSH